MFKPDFTSLPMNPIRYKREKILQYNIAGLARAAGISPQTLRDVELGLPKTIPTKLQEFLDSQFRGNTFAAQYEQWKKDRRSLVFLPPVGILSISSELHPFEQYRNKIGLAISGFCEYLCVPRFVIMKYEESQKKIPRLIASVLIQAHVSQSDVDKLANMGEMFYLAREQRLINAQQRQAHAR